MSSGRGASYARDLRRARSRSHRWPGLPPAGPVLSLVPLANTAVRVTRPPPSMTDRAGRIWPRPFAFGWNDDEFGLGHMVVGHDIARVAVHFDEEARAAGLLARHLHLDINVASLIA